MRKAALALVVCFSIHAGSLYAVCKSNACKQATAWKNGYTAIVLDDNISRSDYFAVLDAVKANKGVVAIEAERVLLGWIPITKAGKIRSTRGVSAVLYEAVQRPDLFVHRDEALAALTFFNHVRTGEFEDTVEAGLAVHAPPLTNCLVARPTPSRAQTQSIGGILLDPQPAEQTGIVRKAGRNRDGDDLIAEPRVPGIIVPQWDFHTPYQNPDMRGRVTVQLFRLDSDGTVDRNDFTWTDAAIATSRDQVYSAYTFWVDQATARGVTLSFRIQTEDPFNRLTRALYPTPTKYEPIWHDYTDDYLWVNDALSLHGYDSFPVTRENVFNKNDQFNEAMKADPAFGPYDRSFSVYIIYNPAPGPATFHDGKDAYAYYDGPFATVLWNSNGWGSINIGVVLTHETGHIFWACDEYGSGTLGCTRCDVCLPERPRPQVTNANCANTSATGSCAIPLTTCVMKDDSHTLCPYTPGQIGW